MYDDFVSYDTDNGIILIKNADILYLIVDGGLDFIIKCTDSMHSLEICEKYKYNLIELHKIITMFKDTKFCQQ